MTHSHSQSIFTIETDRLVLRDFLPSDLPEVQSLRSDPDVMRYINYFPENPDQSRAWLDSVLFHNAQRPRTSYNLAITLRDENRAIGWVGFGDSEQHPGSENFGVGYMIAKDYWGNGYGTETLRAVIAHIVKHLHGRSIYAHCFAENVGSYRVMEKAGMTLLRRYEEIDPRDGRMATNLEYVFRAP
jgi:RimJ/RimL family protein N-acetyltransferase